MPRHDWFDDDTMSREDMRRERQYRDYDDRGAMFDRERDRSDRRSRERIGGWGSLFGDESSGGRIRERNRDRDYGPDDHSNDIPTDETERLIASNKVEGTPVYDRNGERLGSIHNFMVDKFRGQVVYAVLRHSSGFLGLDERYYPLDWDQLTYDTRLGGYRVGLTEEQLKESGSWDSRERWQDRSRGMSPRRDRDREHDYRPDFERGRMRDRW